MDTIVSIQLLQSVIKSSHVATKVPCLMNTPAVLQAFWLEKLLHNAMQARRLHASCHASQKATCLMPCKPGGYMSHAMQARRLHVSWWQTTWSHAHFLANMSAHWLCTYCCMERNTKKYCTLYWALIRILNSTRRNK